MTPTKDDIRSRLTWSDICRYYQLTFKEGKNLSCPFKTHEDKSPSLSFFDTTKFKCHSCGVQGDFFEFIAQMENLDCQKDFPKVLEKAIEIAGGFQTTSRSNPVIPKTPPKLKSQITNAEVEKCTKQLSSSAHVIKYFQGRGISKEMVEGFQLGFGATKKTGGRAKVLIPYFDMDWTPLFFRYRSISDDDPVKIFSPKGVTLVPYLLPGLKDEEAIYICEGEIDTLTLYQHNLMAVGMPSATSFNLEWLPYFAHLKKVTLCFDNDKAGMDGTKRIIELFREKLPHIEISTIQWAKAFPEKGDVNDFFNDKKWHDQSNDPVQSFKALEMAVSEPKPEESKDDLQTKITTFLETPSPKSVFLSDVINEDVFFQNFHLGKGSSLALFSNGKYAEVNFDKSDKFHSFEFEKEMYRFKLPVFPPSPEINRPNKEGLRMFLEGKREDKRILYDDLCAIVQEYYDFYSTDEMYFIVTNIIHSYLLNAIGRTFYVLLDGEAGTGKSSLQTLLSLLQFNGSFSGKTSMPAMVRNIHFFQASQNIDELDKLDKDDKKNAIGILNTGFLKNGAYVIVNMNKNNPEEQEQRFYTFGTKSFSVNKTQFDHSLLSRCIVIHTVRNKRKVKNTFSLSCADSALLQNMRNRLFVYSLLHWKEMVQSIEQNKQYFEAQELFGRPADVYSIICGLHEYFSGKTELREELIKKEAFEKETNKDQDRFYHTLRYIIERLNDPTELAETLTLNAGQISQYLIEEMQINEDRYRPTPQSIGRLLKSQRIVDQNTIYEMVTSGFDKGRRVWKPQKKHLIELINRSHFPELKADLPRN